MYKWGRSRNWMHQKSLSLVHRKNIKKKLQMTALWPRYPRGWGWCKNFQDKRPTRISAGLCELDAVGDEDGNRWMVGEFLCISFLFSFNSFNSFMYNNPEVDKIVTWFLEVSYSIYSRITLSLYIYILTQYFGLPLKIPCGVSLGQFLWDASHVDPYGENHVRHHVHMLITAILLSDSLWPSNKTWKLILWVLPFPHKLY